MTDQKPSDPSQGGGDPWAAFSYVVAGVGVYGLLGWGLARWLHADYLVPLGIVAGAVLGLYLVFMRFGRAPTEPVASETDSTKPTTTANRPTDDRGELAE